MLFSTIQVFGVSPGSPRISSNDYILAVDDVIKIARQKEVRIFIPPNIYNHWQCHGSTVNRCMELCEFNDLAFVIIEETSNSGLPTDSRWWLLIGPQIKLKTYEKKSVTGKLFVIREHLALGYESGHAEFALDEPKPSLALLNELRCRAVSDEPNPLMYIIWFTTSPTGKWQLMIPE